MGGLDGGAGRDTLNIVTTGVDVNLDVSDINFEVVNTQDGDDVLDGSNVLTEGVNFNARGGDDILTGSQFGDTLNAGDGDDMIVGGDGNDNILAGLGADHIDAGAGNDTIQQYSAEDTFLDGGSGNDRLLVDPRSGDITIDLTAQGIECGH